MAGSYARKFSRNLASDGISLLVLHYDGELRPVARDSLRDSLSKGGSLGVFVGRMNILKASEPKNVSENESAIYSVIKPNSVLLFGPPCSGYWFKSLNTIKGLDLYQKGKLAVDHFYLGLKELPITFLSFLRDTECEDRLHTIPDTNLIGQSFNARFVGSPMDELAEAMQSQLSLKLFQCVTELWTESISCLSFEVHRFVRDLVAKKCSKEVVNSIEATLLEHIADLVEQCSQMEQNDHILTFVSDIWHGNLLRNCEDFFPVPPGLVKGVGLKVFGVLCSEIEVCQKVLDVFTISRATRLIDKRLMKNVILMLLDMELYLGFEDLFLRSATQYYSDELSTENTEDVCSLLCYEAECSSHYLPNSSVSKFTTIVRRLILERWTDPLKSHLLSNHEIDLSELSVIHPIFIKSEILSKVIFDWIHDWFGDCVSFFTENPSSGDDSLDKIEAIVKFVGSYHSLAENVFTSSVTYMDSCIASVVAANPSYAELISLFIDKKFCDIAKGKEAGDLDTAVSIVEMLSNKDYFEMYFLKHLAKRLAFGSTNIEMELNFLSKFDTAWSGKLFHHSKLMIEDIFNSEDIMESFRSSRSDKFGLSVKVFDSSVWPLAKSATDLSVSKSCTLPPEAEEMVKEFESYFKSLKGRSGQKLEWFTDFGNALLDGNFASGTYRLHASTHQMCILMLFNNDDYLTVGDIQDATGIESADLKIALEQLWKKDVLLSICKDGTHYFYVNDDFFPDGDKVNSSSLITNSLKESRPDFVRTQNKLKSFRDYAIQAAIARLLKSHRLMRHTELVAAVTLKLQKYFVPDVPEIKVAIERLIASELISRDENDPDLYHYVE